MKETHNNDEQLMVSRKRIKRRRRCLLVIGTLLLLLILLFIVALVLALTAFKSKNPRTQLISATLDGIAPRFSFPAIKIQLNVTLDLKLLVENPNHANFKHGQGKSLLLYKGNQVGETDIYPGLIPAKGSTTLSSRLTLQLDKLASNIASFIGEVMEGQLSVDSFTRIPGKVSFLGIIRKHVLAVSECHFTFAVRDMKIQNQTCKSKTKL